MLASQGRRLALESVTCFPKGDFDRSRQAAYQAGLHQAAGRIYRKGLERTAMTRLEFPIIIEPLSKADGGGFVAIAPDLPGCMSDGDSPEAALASVQDAIAAWIEEAREVGRAIPAPSKHLTAAE
jgi:predicted RNase H-like HicB family nuclease